MQNWVLNIFLGLKNIIYGISELKEALDIIKSVLHYTGNLKLI